MSIYGQRDSLDWPSLFSISEKEKSKLIGFLQNDSDPFGKTVLVNAMLSTTDFPENQYWGNSAFETACEKVALKFMIEDTSFAKDVLSDEDYEKAKQTFSRKQYNTKILQLLLSYFTHLIRNHSENLRNLFTIDLLNSFRIAKEEESDRAFGTLKKTIEKAASGVKSSCYSKAERSFIPGFEEIKLDSDLNTYLFEQIHYDFNNNNSPFKSQSSTLFFNQEDVITNRIMQIALLDNASFWTAHANFQVVSFINEIAKQNDEKHAEKVLQYVFDNLRKMKNMDVVLQNGFPLYASQYDALLVSLEEQAHRFTFKRLEPFCDISILNDVPLCYPMSDIDDRFLAEGRVVWDKFISSYNYPTEYQKVNQFLENEVDRFVSGETHKYDDIAVILDASIFRFAADSQDRDFFKAYRADCFSSRNIWNRVYLKAYAATRLSDKEKDQFSFLQRIFVDLVKTIEERTGICTAHQLDESARNENFEHLKSKLQSFGITVTDTHKDDYVIALLDRDTARLSEAKLFPELEQLGDAVYGLAVAELLFYNPKTEEMAKLFEHYTRAEAQVAISVKNGFNKMYLQTGLPAKYVEYDTLFTNNEAYLLDREHLQTLNQEKYLADSLEMIIAAVCRDAGIEEAIRFTKELIKTTYPKQFVSEIHPSDENLRNPDIERDYWSRILPALCSDDYNEYVSTLSRALDKFMLCVSIGTDTKEKRQFITYSHGNTAMYGETISSVVSWFFYRYLANGLSFVVENYKNTIINYYNKH